MENINILGYVTINEIIGMSKSKRKNKVSITYKMVKPRLYIVDDYLNCKLEEKTEDIEVYNYKGCKFVTSCGDYDYMMNFLDKGNYYIMVKSHTPDTVLIVSGQTIQSLAGVTLKTRQQEEVIKDLIATLKEGITTIPATILEVTATYLYRNFYEIMEIYLLKQDELKEYDCEVVSNEVTGLTIEDLMAVGLLEFYIKIVKVLMAISPGKYSYKHLYNDKKSMAVEIKNGNYILIPIFVEGFEADMDIIKFINMINKL